MTKPPSRYRDGTPYDGQKRYLGNGILRSCGKCGGHFPPGTLAKWRGVLLACKDGCVKNKEEAK